MEERSPSPTGTVTFLFSDLEGSTKQWQEHPGAMGVAVARHDALLREAVEPTAGTSSRRWATPSTPPSPAPPRR